jgi:hypothetical protein
MKRSSNFLIAFVAAAITFGTLNLVIGPKHFEWRGHYRYGHGGHWGSYHGEDKKHQDKDGKTTAPDKDDSQHDF